MNARTLLHVDDGSDDAILLRAACRAGKVTFRLQTVPDGEKALCYLKGLAPYEDRKLYPWPDLVLLDLKMPRQSGFDVLEWLRKQDSPAMQNLPVIVFTSSVHEEDRQRALQSGATQYWIKPVRLGVLIEVCKTLDQALARPDFDAGVVQNLTWNHTGGSEPATDGISTA
jgi:CheY-like chemotaxis protein